jgi:AAA15 family ATPase/GTPase
MKNMNPIFSLKNFRSFGEDDADFELAPITVLTGCNSAGKSSLVKAILLLSKENRNITYYSDEIGRLTPSNTLPVSAQDLALGRFDKVLNTNAKNGTIELSYCIWSNYLQETVKVTRKYQTHINDPLDNGKLISYFIKKLDGTIIYKYPKYINVDQSDEVYYDKIQKNYDIFQSALKYLIEYQVFESKYPLHKTIDVANESAEMKEMREKVDELKNQMQGHPLEDFGNSLHHWSEIVEKRRKEKQAELYELKSFEEKAKKIGLKDIAIDMACRIEKKEKEDEDENNKELYGALFCNEVIQPAFLQDVLYADSSSASIKRLYSIEDNNKLCNVLRKYYNRKLSDHDVLCTNYPDSFLNKWLKEFDLGERIEIEGTDQGLGMQVFLKQKNGNRRLLADEGYGITQLVSLFLYIDNIIPLDPEFPEYKGYGEWEAEYKPRYIYVEEPEIHLHPKYQSLLADMFVEAYQKYNIHFIIETHSEYLIRKLQVMVADKDNALTPNDVSLNYVEKEDGISTNRKIEILEDGRLSEPFGPGFFDEATDLSMRLLKMKMEAK